MIFPRDQERGVQNHRRLLERADVARHCERLEAGRERLRLELSSRLNRDVDPLAEVDAIEVRSRRR